MQPPRRLFVERMRERGLRVTAERLAILEQAFRLRGHFDAEALTGAVRASGSPASRATVYRTLGHLVETGLLRRLEMPEGAARYEPEVGRPAHEHLLCVECGAMFEFVEDGIERLQGEVCRRYDFRPLTLSLQIRGVCRSCRRRAARSGRGGKQLVGAP